MPASPLKLFDSVKGMFAVEGPQGQEQISFSQQAIAGNDEGAAQSLYAMEQVLFVGSWEQEGEDPMDILMREQMEQEEQEWERGIPLGFDDPDEDAVWAGRSMGPTINQREPQGPEGEDESQ